uniref:Secreted protein n=1 Tax=Heterorhabditis bacteriophora TaxID=37862 RepID=A0A1I7WA93_HETBA
MSHAFRRFVSVLVLHISPLNTQYLIINPKHNFQGIPPYKCRSQTSQTLYDTSFNISFQLITTLPPPPNKNGFMPVPTTCPEDGQHGHNS